LSRRSGSEAHGRYGDEGGEEEAAVAGGGGEREDGEEAAAATGEETGAARPTCRGVRFAPRPNEHSSGPGFLIPWAVCPGKTCGF
jgi:hypothetical protein